MAKEFNAAVKLSIIDRMTAPLRRMTNNWEAFGKGMKRAERMFDIAGKMKHAADGVEDFSRGARDMLAKPLKTSIDFQKTMSEVAAQTFKGDMTGDAPAQLEALRLKARELGADTWASASQAAEGMVVLATAGLSAEEQLKSMKSELDLAAAAHVEIAEAADVSIATMKQYGLQAEDMAHISDVLVNTISSSSINLTDLSESLKYIGADAHDAGISLETTTALIGALGNTDIKGSQAGTALRGILAGLQTPDKKAKSALAFLGIKTTHKGEMKPIEQLLGEIDKAFDRKFGKGKQSARRAKLLAGMFDLDSKTAGGILAKLGTKGLRGLTAANTNIDGVAAKVSAAMTDNTAGSVAELDSAMEELSLTVGDEVLPAFRSLVLDGTEAARAFGAWAKEHPELVKNLALVTGAIAGIGLVLSPVLLGVSSLLTVMGGWAAVKGTMVDAGKVIVGSLRAITAAAIANPIIAIITGIAVAAYLIYDNWETISAWWSGLWDKLPGPVQSALRLATIPIRMFVAAGQWLYENWSEVSAGFVAAIDLITSPITWLINAAVELMGGWEAVGGFFTNLWDGISSTVGGAIDWIAEKLTETGKAIEDFERTLPEWMTGREREAVSGATDMMRERLQAKGISLQAQGAPLPVAANDSSLISKFMGQLKITVEEGRVIGTQMSSSGDANFETRVNRGGQAA